jgi:hypothetical protein
VNIWSILMHSIGTYPRTPSTAYNFWSGFGSDIGEFTIVSGALVMLHKHNCHEGGCWRLSRHTVVDPQTGEHVVRCRKHHKVWKESNT